MVVSRNKSYHRRKSRQRFEGERYLRELTKFLRKQNGRKLQKVAENGVELKPIVFALFSQNEKSATRISSKLLIFKVDQLGLEPRTSRLWVSQSDIPWDFVVCNVRQGTQVDDRSNEEAYSWGQWNVSSLFSAFCSLMFPSFHVFGTKVRQFSGTAKVHSYQSIILEGVKSATCPISPCRK